MGRSGGRASADSPDLLKRGLRRMGPAKLFWYQILLIAGIWAISIAAEDGTNAADLRGGVTGAQELLQVKPKLPTGPVVKQYKKMLAKKKMAREIVRQDRKLKPVLKRKKLKNNAQKKNFKMMSDLEVENITMMNELKLKGAARDWNKEKTKRKRLAKKRRIKRYALHWGEKIDQAKERLSKIGSHTHASFETAQKVQRARKAAKDVVDQAAEADAKRRDDLRVGGLIHLRGKQLVIKKLTDLNKILAQAKKHPTAQNIRMAKLIYEDDATWVAKENMKKQIIRRRVLAKRKEKKRKKIQKEKNLKTSLLNKQKERNRKEDTQKKAAKEKLQKSILNSSEAGQKRLRKINEHARKRNAKRKAKERAQKTRRNESKTKTLKEKSAKRPLEIYRKSQVKMRERGKKAERAIGAHKKEAGSVRNYAKASAKASKLVTTATPQRRKEAAVKSRFVKNHLKRHQASLRYKEKRVKVTKVQRERSKKSAKERGNKAKVKWASRRRRIAVRSRAKAVNFSTAQIKAKYGYCLDAAGRARSGGLVHLWPCNKRNWNQQWNYNSKTGLIKNSHGICLDSPQRNRNGGKVHMWGCNANNWNQQWRYNAKTGQVKSRHGSKCLNFVQSQAKVQMWTCTSGNPQTWKFSNRL